ncbi:MAG TPA: peptidase domain-containing ABC transporter [Woeseiaceae bacterium]|nr:peptidase domain-containing ABC transporter [Woeseiaceae bacterium]
MRTVLQAEASECGLACLAMACDHYGRRMELRELRQLFQLSLRGATLAGIMQAASELGLQTRPLRLDIGQLDRLALPALLHWNLNHFVVLARAGRRRIVILDPAFGKRRLTYGQASAHFTGVALELSPAADFTPRNAPPAVSLRQLTGGMTGLWSGLAMVLLLSLALQVFVIVGPFFLQWVVDQVLVSADRSLLTVLGLGFGLLLLLRVGTALLRGWAVVYLSARLGLQWMGSVFSHLLQLPLDFFGKRHLGDVVSRLGSVRSIQRTLTTSFVEAIIDGLMAVVTFGMMLLYSRKLAFISLLAVSLYLALRALCFRLFREGTEQQLLAAAKQQSYLLETVRGIQSVKVAGVQRQRETGYGQLMNETVDRDVWLARFGLAFTAASGIVFGIERIAVVWIGALLALDSRLSVGMLVAYLAYQDQFAGRVGGLIDKWIELRMLRLHGERLADIVLTPPEEDRALATAEPLQAGMRIRVRELSFRYGDSEPWILENLSFTVEEGEAVAIVGASGCGKSTLLKLLLGLLKPTSGSIQVGGQDLSKVGAQHYRSFVSAVMQDDQLFAGSVSENIAFGDVTFDPDRVRSAARLAAVHEEIAAMPMGYQTLIGDMGTTLSGGQKQRVILARALYRKPRLLLLDEATSHLDIRSERLVNEAVRRMHLTRVIVAHRPETIASADRVLLLRGGRIDREGRPRAAAVKAGSASETAVA